MVREVLEKELKELEPKITRARENNDFGTYKNMILAYKEVLHLLQEVDKNKSSIQQNNDGEIVASHYCGDFMLHKKKSDIIIDYAYGYSFVNNFLIIHTQVIDKDILMNLKKNQFKGYILTHKECIRNTSQVDSYILKEYKILFSDFIVKNIDGNRARYTLRFKIKPIKDKKISK